MTRIGPYGERRCEDCGGGPLPWGCICDILEREKPTMTLPRMTRQERINYDVAIRKGMSGEDAYRHARNLTIQTNDDISRAAMRRYEDEVRRAREKGAK